MATIKVIQDEIEEWAHRNFGDRGWRWPLMGIIEELGEYTHAQLKQEQGIRGTYEEHNSKKRDALGDIMIYLFDYAWRSGNKISDVLVERHLFDLQVRVREEDTSWMFAAFMYDALGKGRPSRGPLSRTDIHQLVVNLCILAKRDGWHLHQILEETWSKVKMRDWKKNALTGGEAPDSKSEAAAPNTFLTPGGVPPEGWPKS